MMSNWVNIYAVGSMEMVADETWEQRNRHTVEPWNAEEHKYR